MYKIFVKRQCYLTEDTFITPTINGVKEVVSKQLENTKEGTDVTITVTQTKVVYWGDNNERD